MNENINKKNIKIALILAIIAVFMLSFGPVIAPYYDKLCCKLGVKTGKQCTDYELIKTIDFSKKNLSRNVDIVFITTLNRTTPMDFRAETSMLKIHPGEYYTVNFYAKNNSDHELTAQAYPNFEPGLTADYFRKIECFCFTKQTFKPKEAKTMPVRFVVSADLPEQFNSIILSYTIFDITDKSVK